MIRRAALLWLGVVLLAAGYLGLRLHDGLKFRTDLLALLPGTAVPGGTQADAASRRLDDRVAATISGRMVVIVGHPDAAQARAAARAIAGRLTAAGLADIPGRGVDREAMLRLGALYAPYRDGLLADADRTLLQAGRVDTMAERAMAKVFGFVGMADAGQVRADPFLLLTDFFAALPLPASGFQPDDDAVTRRTDGVTWVLLCGHVLGEPFALNVQRRITDALDAAQAEATQAHPGLQVLRLGAVFFAGAGAAAALHETTLIGIASLIGTVVLVLVAYRSAQALWQTSLSMGVGILVALSCCLALFGTPHVAALLFGVSLIGVVVDYSLQYCTEIFALPLEAPRARLRRVLVGISIGTATTMIGYLTLLLAPFPGLRQIAVFSAVGLAAAWVTVVLWLPTLDRSPPPRHGADMLALAARVAAWWDGPALRRRLAPVLAVLAVVILTGWMRLAPDDNVRHMQSLSPDLLSQRQRIAELIGAAGEPRFFAVAAPDDETALRREEALAERLRPLLGTALGGFQMPAQYVPSATRQRENRTLVRTHLDGEARRHQAARFGIAAGDGAPDDTAPVLTLAQALAGPLGFLADMVLPGQDGQVLHLVPLEGVRESALLTQAADGLEGVRLFDPAGDFSRLLGRYREHAVWLLALSAALMWPLLAWRYGLRRGTLVMLPPGLAVLLAPALRALGGGGFTFFDAMAQVLILSIGVDYAVFCAETTPQRRAVTMLAVALAALAALLSFGLLALSDVAAVRGFGLTMTLGITAAFILAPMTHSGEGRLPAAVHWASLAERGTGWGLRFVALCYRLFGRRPCLAVLRPIVLYFYMAGGRRRGWTHAYLARVAGITGNPARPWRDGYRIYLNFAARALDTFIALQAPDQVGPIRVTGGELLQGHVRAGVGGLMIVSHHGNVDICRAALAPELGQVVNVLLHTREAVRYNEVLRRVRPAYMAHTIQVSEIGPATAIEPGGAGRAGRVDRHRRRSPAVARRGAGQSGHVPGSAGAVQPGAVYPGVVAAVPRVAAVLRACGGRLPGDIRAVRAPDHAAPRAKGGGVGRLGPRLCRPPAGALPGRAIAMVQFLRVLARG